MHVTLTNLNGIPIPMSSSQDAGFADVLQPNAPFSLNNPAITVISVGRNPSALEEFRQGMRELFDKLGHLLALWGDGREKNGDNEMPPVRVSIVNHGTNGLRLLLGSNMNEVQVGAGGNYEAAAAEYIELRELCV